MFEENETSFESPFDIDLRCNINIETNVAMRLGELILKSSTMDKQLLALGYKLSNSMVHLVDNLDDKQWEKLTSYIEEQSDDSETQPVRSTPSSVAVNHPTPQKVSGKYVSKSRQSMRQLDNSKTYIPKYADFPRTR